MNSEDKPFLWMMITIMVLGVAGIIGVTIEQVNKSKCTPKEWSTSDTIEHSCLDGKIQPSSTDSSKTMCVCGDDK